MFGPEKAGKSRWLRSVLAHAFYEKTLFGQPTRLPGRVLYLAGEELPEEITAALMRNVRTIGCNPKDINWSERVTYVSAAGMRLDRHEQRQWIRNEIEDGGYSHVLIDPLRRVHAAKESSNDEMAYICNAFRQWTNELGVTMLVIHHTGKLGEHDDESRIATWARGASDLASVLDWATYITRQGDNVQVMRGGRGPQRDTLSLHDDGEGKRWVLKRGKL